MRSVIGLDVAAEPLTVFGLARDVERWPKLLPHYLDVRVERRTDVGVIARFVARRPLIPWLGIGLPVAWRSLAWSEPASRRLRFRHLGGLTDGMDVTWTIEPRPDGCHVAIEHDFRPRLAPWAPLVDRLFVRPIATRTLASFKAIAEALTETS
jgi:ribosome-associated toxin RatA of RatAB toxin-antitoxin module